MFHFELLTRRLNFYFFTFELLTQSRHSSHVTNSRVFKNLNLRRKGDRIFCGNLLKNHLGYIKLHSNSPSLLARSRCHISAFWNTKGWSSHFWEDLSGFATWNFTAKEDLNPRKQVFLLNLRLWPAQKPEIWSFFHGIKFIWENYVV